MGGWKKHAFRAGPAQDEFDELTTDAKAVERWRSDIEPWLTAVFQSEHLSLLVGSGLSAGLAACGGKKALSMARVTFDAKHADKVDKHAELTAKACGRQVPNIEDQLRAAIALHEGLRVAGAKSDLDAWDKAITSVLGDFARGVLVTEADIRDALAEPDGRAYGVLLGFLMSFASRAASRERLGIFTTNYDRLIEHGCDLLGLRMIDRFVGALAPEFRSSRQNVDLHYNPPGVRGEPRYLEGVVRLTKLHGSIDWRMEQGRLTRRPLPFGAPKDHSEFPTDPFGQCMIFPNAAKDYETLFFPYAELFRDFAASVCQPNSTLVTYGYGFGDDHVNRVIRDMLSLPSTHLVIISFSGADGRIQAFHDSVRRDAQVSLLVGSHFGDLQTLVENYLPKPAIDPITFRMMMLRERRGEHTGRGRLDASAEGDTSGGDER